MGVSDVRRGDRAGRGRGGQRGTVKPLMKGLAADRRVRNWRGALRRLEGLQRQKIRLDVLLCSAAVSVCATRSRWSWANWLLSEATLRVAKKHLEAENASLFLGPSLEDGYELTFEGQLLLRRARHDVSLGVSESTTAAGTGAGAAGWSGL
eukprot:g23787.t1